MSKPWFLEMTMNAKPSPLADAISKVLGSSSTVKPIKDLPKEITQGVNGLHIGE